MCRHLAYLGPPISLARLLYSAPHSLSRQSFAPQDMRGGGSINADGFGVGWYQPDRTAPIRYRRDCPLWTDASLPGLAEVTVAGGILAAVRNATAGMPVMESAVAPFTEGPWLFSHNGVVAGWPDSMTGLARRLPVRDLLTMEAPTDAALLWALTRQLLRAGATPGDAVAEVVHSVAEVAPASRLNLLLTDGHTAVATTYGHGLSIAISSGATFISSEPIDDDPAWAPVPDQQLVIATAGSVSVQPLSATDLVQHRPIVDEYAC